jgi:hypothetical protein
MRSQCIGRFCRSGFWFRLAARDTGAATFGITLQNFPHGPVLSFAAKLH